MKDKKILTYLSMVAVFAVALFMLFRANTQSFKRLSASVSPEEEKNIIIEKAKKYIEDNINNFDGKNEIVLKNLIEENYLTEEEKADVTRDLYDENTRIFFEIENTKIKDIYLKDEMFNKLFKCSDVCYINDNNYIYYNNDVYQIIKVDSNGNIYITNNEIKAINTKDINTILRNKYNELDKKISNTIDFVTIDDIHNSSIINPERDLIISSSTGYKIYDTVINDVRDIDVDHIDAIFVIKILNTVNYKTGDGTRFNPYVVSE